MPIDVRGIVIQTVFIVLTQTAGQDAVEMVVDKAMRNVMMEMMRILMIIVTMIVPT